MFVFICVRIKPHKTHHGFSYLNNLTTHELKDIMKSNQMRVTNNGSYYNKKEMVGKIYNFYK